MGFRNPWYLLLLLFIPVIILLYLLKQKAEERPFPSLLLWREAYENIQAATPWERLRKNLLMLLQILIVAALAIALASPYLKRGDVSHARAILAVDTSASMNALHSDGQTRLDKAVEAARDYVASMGADMQVTILSMDQKATVHGVNITDRGEAQRLLSSLKAADLAGNPDHAINTVSSLLRQEGECDVVFFTDEAMDLSALEQARLVDVSSVGANGCIDYVSSGLSDGGLVVMARVSNPSPEAFASDINLYLDDSLVAIGAVSLAPGESEILYFDGIDPAGAVLRAEINERDLLAGDNTAYALLNAQSESRVLLITPGNVFLEKSIALVEGVELYKASELMDWSAAPEFDLYIFDGILPDTLPERGNCILLNPSGELAGIVPAGQPAERLAVTAAKTPITTHLEEFSFGVSAARPVTPPAWAKSFFMAENASVGYYGEYEGRTMAVLCFDLHDSDFALKTEFPIFIHNLITQSITQGLLYSHSYATGDTLTLRPGVANTDLTIISPRGEAFSLPASRLARTFHELDDAGLYRITDHQELEVPFIVQFPVASESRIAAVGSEESGGPGSGTASPSAAGGRDLAQPLLIAALLLLLAEWALYLKKSARLS